jgi:hypothetical protein
MVNSKVLKVTCSWISIVYAVCFGGVALMPGIRPWFMEYALHTEVGLGANVVTLTTFITGLVIWNVVAVLAVWLYRALDNYFK